MYNIKKIKKMWGEGEGQYLNQKHSMYIKKEKEKKVKKQLTEPEFEPTTFGLEIR